MPGSRRRGARRAAGLTAVALGATGLVVAAGVLTGGGAAGPLDGSGVALSAAAPTPSPLSDTELAERTDRASRSEGDRTAVLDRGKARTLASDAGRAATKSQDLADADPKTLARALMPQFGMSASEFGCLDSLWSGESGWRVDADNPSSSAYGIPQALPGSKMASAGADWATNPATQIKWGLGYIRDRYGSACGAESFKQGNGWY
ncbi:aggregation-promoting factor C-terminal-like domain-containing protein [Nocardioides scoriae]|uniref:aggregation-promoting factor C-terminal-like domain-containing protein n=1 Tax=Nocardioides scoriae TaxID=642780 RepID=UPI0018D4165D|nr:lytic transglycosylase domain-containing protein [Nocardioides scoriae]